MNRKAMIAVFNAATMAEIIFDLSRRLYRTVCCCQHFASGFSVGVANGVGLCDSGVFAARVQVDIR